MLLSVNSPLKCTGVCVCVYSVKQHTNGLSEFLVLCLTVLCGKGKEMSEYEQIFRFSHN